MSKNKYKFYIQRMVWVENENTGGHLIKNYPYSNPIDIEKNYDALYCECKGIDTIGEPKNVYTEEYSDSASLRTFAPKTVYRKATDVELTLHFIGEKRYENYHRFVSDLSSRPAQSDINTSLWRYYDTARKRGFDFVYIDNTTLEDDVWKGSLPYLKVKFKLKNIYGISDATKKIYPNESA